MKVFVLVNRGSGSNSSAGNVEELRSGFAKLKLKPDIRIVDGPDIMEAAATALKTRPDAVVAAGGDGTVSAIASVLAGTDTPLGVLPQGTLNHFAKDLNIPMDMEAAMIVIKQNFSTLVDAGRVNEHYFVNNSSVGAYPWVVQQRDSGWVRRRLGKWVAMAGACASCLRHFPLSRVRITLDEKQVLHIKTPFIFIGNNEYRIELSGFGNRQDIHSGRLCVYTVKHEGRLGILKAAYGVILGNLEKADHFEKHMVSQVKIESGEPVLSVALDGEVIPLNTPLHYTIQPSALHVIVPQVQKNEEAEEDA